MDKPPNEISSYNSLAKSPFIIFQIWLFSVFGFSFVTQQADDAKKTQVETFRRQRFIFKISKNVCLHWQTNTNANGKVRNTNTHTHIFTHREWQHKPTANDCNENEYSQTNRKCLL